MQILGLDYITKLIDAQEGFEAKCVFNAHGAIFFSANQQHRDQKAPGISYEDDYKGNALAAMIAPGRFEIRFHRAFTDADVANIVAVIANTDQLAALKNWDFTYQGRPIAPTPRQSHPRSSPRRPDSHIHDPRPDAPMIAPSILTPTPQ